MTDMDTGQTLTTAPFHAAVNDKIKIEVLHTAGVNLDLKTGTKVGITRVSP
jgi:hypothetical protein